MSKGTEPSAIKLAGSLPPVRAYRLRRGQEELLMALARIKPGLFRALYANRAELSRSLGGGKAMTLLLAKYDIDVPWLRIVLSGAARDALTGTETKALHLKAIERLYRLTLPPPNDRGLDTMDLRRLAEQYVSLHVNRLTVEVLAAHQKRAVSTITTNLKRFAAAAQVPFDLRRGRRMGSKDRTLRSRKDTT